MIGRDERPLLHRRRIIGLGAFVVALIAGALWVARDRWQTALNGPARGEERTPYLNARPGVAFVGDEACTRCHAEIAADYRLHPMGRSLATADQASQREPRRRPHGDDVRGPGPALCR